MKRTISITLTALNALGSIVTAAMALDPTKPPQDGNGAPLMCRMTGSDGVQTITVGLLSLAAFQNLQTNPNPAFATVTTPTTTSIWTYAQDSEGNPGATQQVMRVLGDPNAVANNEKADIQGVDQVEIEFQITGA